MTDAADNADVCTQAEFAQRQGWGKSYVTKLKLEGRLVMTDDGKKVRAAESLARIQQGTERPGQASPPAVSQTTRNDRDRQAFYDAEKSRLDLEERVHKLLQADETLSALADAAVTLRGALETWPERLSPVLASLGGDEVRIRAVLAEHVEEQLAAISNRFAAMVPAA